MLLGDIAHRGATLWPDRIAFAWGDARRDYGELAERVSRLQGSLAAGGVRAGSRIALLSVSVPEVIEVAFAASLLGAVIVPLNVRLGAEEIRFQIDDADARHAVVHPALVDLAHGAGLLDLTHWIIGPELGGPGGVSGPAGPAAVRAGRPPIERPEPGAPVMQLYTSGTTGHPKGCLLTSRGWITAAANAVQAFGLTAEDRMLGGLPLFHVAGYGAVLGQLSVGGTVVLPATADPGEAWGLVARHGVTVAVFPAGTGPALRHPDAAPASLRLVFGMAGRERRRTLEALAAAGCAFRGVYGSTEAGNFVLVSTLAEELDRPGTLGRALPPFDLCVAAPDGSALGPGEVGELLIRGSTVMVGYAGLPTATAEALAEGWLHTGDLVRRDPEGFFTFEDRAKDMIKTGGENVYSAEVERVLAGHPGVVDVAVVGVPDRRWGEAVKAYVVPRGGLAPDQLDHYCRERMGRFKRPRWYEFVEVIPRNHTGKILKRELRSTHDPEASTHIPGSG